MDSRLGDMIHIGLQRNIIWGEDALDRMRLFVYHGTQLFTISMSASFFLFLYYFAFGFVVGSIAESNMEESVTKGEDSSPAKSEPDIKREDMSADADDGNEEMKAVAALSDETNEKPEK